MITLHTHEVVERTEEENTYSLARIENELMAIRTGLLMLEQNRREASLIRQKAETHLTRAQSSANTFSTKLDQFTAILDEQRQILKALPRPPQRTAESDDSSLLITVVRGALQGGLSAAMLLMVGATLFPSIVLSIGLAAYCSVIAAGAAACAGWGYMRYQQSFFARSLQSHTQLEEKSLSPLPTH